MDNRTARVKAIATSANLRKWYNHFLCHSTHWWNWSTVGAFRSNLFSFNSGVSTNGHAAHWWLLLSSEHHGLEFGNLDGLRLVLFKGLVEQLTQFLVVSLEFGNLFPVMGMQYPQVSQLNHPCGNNVI